MAAKAASLAWMLAMSQRKIHACPSLLGIITSSNVAASYRIVAQPDVKSVIQPRLLQQNGVCLASVYDLNGMSSWPRSMLKATVNVVASFALPCSDAAAAPPELMHRQEAAGRLVDVHDAVCAGSVLVHQPAQLDEEPVRVSVLLLRAVELFHALGRLLATQSACHARAV